TRDEFLSIASHELKTPLSSLLLILQLALKFGESQEHPQAKEQIERAAIQARRLAGLINELLDLTRIRAGKLELKLSSCNLEEIIAEAIQQLNIEIARSGSTISFRIKSSVAGMFDASRINQVVTNLISNAAKYGEGKPIEVSLSSVDQRAALISVR